MILEVEATTASSFPLPSLAAQEEEEELPRRAM